MTTNATSLQSSHYKKSFGWLAGYLPEDIGFVDAWLQDLHKTVEQKRADGKKQFNHQSVQDLSDLIYGDSIIRMYVTEMLQQSAQSTPPAADDKELIDSMLFRLDEICEIAPVYNDDKNKRMFFPMSALFVHGMATAAGKALFRNWNFNQGLRKVQAHAPAT